MVPITMALILNEGWVEESVTWVSKEGEEGEEQKDTNLHIGGNLEPIDEMLIVKKQKHATAQPKLEGTREPPSSNCRKLAVFDALNPMRTLAKYVLQ
ncbi:hypothetical protein AAC387_Pa12g0875 [Persea americana]